MNGSGSEGGVNGSSPMKEGTRYDIKRSPMSGSSVGASHNKFNSGGGQNGLGYGSSPSSNGSYSNSAKHNFNVHRLSERET